MSETKTRERKILRFVNDFTAETPSGPMTYHRGDIFTSWVVQDGHVKVIMGHGITEFIPMKYFELVRQRLTTTVTIEDVETIPHA